MRQDRPLPGEELGPSGAAPTPARQAATMILLRDSADGPEVLLVQRNPEARFMGGAWVFPGGAVHDDDAGHLGTAVRELEEEADIALGEDDEVLHFSRWITPAAIKTRFDTWFFLARAPEGAVATPDGGECVDARWLRPADALEASRRGELTMVFPTIKHLEQLTRHESVDALIAAARAREITPVQPRVVLREDGAEVLLPGEPGYDEQ